MVVNSGCVSMGHAQSDGIRKSNKSFVPNLAQVCYFGHFLNGNPNAQFLWESPGSTCLWNPVGLLPPNQTSPIEIRKTSHRTPIVPQKHFRHFKNLPSSAVQHNFKELADANVSEHTLNRPSTYRNIARHNHISLDLYSPSRLRGPPLKQTKKNDTFLHDGKNDAATTKNNCCDREQTRQQTLPNAVFSCLLWSTFFKFYLNNDRDDVRWVFVAGCGCLPVQCSARKIPNNKLPTPFAVNCCFYCRPPHIGSDFLKSSTASDEPGRDSNSNSI